MKGFAGRSDFLEELFCLEKFLGGSVDFVESDLVGKKLAYDTGKRGKRPTELRLCH